MTELEIERETYRTKCKHHSYEDVCCLKSGWNGSFHMTWGCDCKCRRMRNWDKKHNYNDA